MIKKISFSLLSVLLLVVFLIPTPVLAKNGLAVVSSSAEVDFPARIIFNISAESNAEITDIRLRYRIDRLEHAQITSEVYIQFIPALSVDAGWVWDMRKTGGLPPGSSVIYWWIVADADGDTLETQPVTINIEDRRYDWDNIAEGNVILYWYEGDDVFIHELMGATQEALSELAENTGAELEDKIQIYIYASSQDLKGSMIFPQEWTGGVAFTRYGVIAIGIPPTTAGLEWGKRVIAHELTHLVIHRVTFNPYSDIPTWLDEGLAMTAEGELESQFVAALNNAREHDDFITVRSLSSPFSAYADESMLAYAESYMIVSYLINEFGREKMFDLLSTFQHGAGYDEALNKVYNFDMDELHERWLDYYYTDTTGTLEKVNLINTITASRVTSSRVGMPVTLQWALTGLAVVVFVLLALLVANLARRRSG
jgi:hypothetical protein